MQIPAARKLIVFIHGGNAIDSESTHLLRRILDEFGFELADVSVVDENAQRELQRLIRERGDEIFFFFSSNYWALNVRNGKSLLHTLTGIPLVILMHDHPVYFLHYLSPSLEGALTFAPGHDAEDFIKKYYSPHGEIVLNPNFLSRTIAQTPDREQFLARRNAVLCPVNLAINGLTIDDTWALIKGLPAHRRTHATALIDVALTDCTTPLHVHAERLQSGQLPANTLDDLRLVLNYVKLWRRTWLVRQIAELPALISTSYVPAKLKRKHPDKFTLLSMPETIPLYGEYRFAVNSTPMLVDYLHDRVTETLINNTICITDANDLISRTFHDEVDMLFIDYSRANLAEKITRYIDDPQLAFQLTENACAVRKREHFSENAYRSLFASVEQIWSLAPRQTQPAR